MAASFPKLTTAACILLSATLQDVFAISVLVMPTEHKMLAQSNLAQATRHYLGLDYFESTGKPPVYPTMGQTFTFATLFLIGVWALSNRVVKTCDGLKPEPYKYSMLYSSASFVCLSASFMGFFPGAIVAAQTGEWFSDAFARTNRPSVIEAVAHLGLRWDVLLTMHIFAAFVWLFLAFGQVYSGLRGRFNERLLQWHKTAGSAAATVGVVALLLGLLLELLKPPRVEGYLLVTLNVLTVIMVIVNICVGVYYVKGPEKQVHNHKVAMAWACSWSADTGGTKLFSYLIKYLSGKSMYDPFVLTVAVVLWTFLMMAFLLSPASVDRNTRTLPQLVNIILLELRLVFAAAVVVGLMFRTLMHAGVVVLGISLFLAALNTALVNFHRTAMAPTESQH